MLIFWFYLHVPQADERIWTYTMETVLSCSSANLHLPEVPEIAPLATCRNFAVCFCHEPVSQFTTIITTQMCQEGSQRSTKQPKLITQSTQCCLTAVWQQLRILSLSSLCLPILLLFLQSILPGAMKLWTQVINRMSSADIESLLVIIIFSLAVLVLVNTSPVFWGFFLTHCQHC